MNTRENPNTYPRTSDIGSDEIDLKELLLTLWDGRLLIIAVTLLVSVAAVAYAYLSTPVYKAEVALTTPSAANQLVFSYSYDSILSSNPDASPFEHKALTDTANSNYQQFVETLTASATRIAFFEQYPQLISSGAIAISNNNRNVPNNIVTVSGSDPVKVAELANLYTDYAIAETKNNIAKSITDLKTAKSHNLNNQANTLRIGAKQKRQQRISALQEALQLAESLNLEQPATNGNLAVTLTSETAYMRGAQALRNEINLLQKRTSDDNFIPDLVGINQQIALLNNVNINAANINVAQIISPAIEPKAPIKPRKNLIIAVGIVLGGMLGIFLVLMRNMFKD